MHNIDQQLIKLLKKNEVAITIEFEYNEFDDEFVITSEDSLAIGRDLDLTMVDCMKQELESVIVQGSDLWDEE